LEPFREVQKNAASLSMKHGDRSAFGLIGQLLEDIQEQNWTEDLKWEAWKDTCNIIRKLNTCFSAKIEGGKVADVQNLIEVIFEDPGRMKVTRFEEVIRYTEYCRRLALHGHKPKNMALTNKSTNTDKGNSNNFDFSQPYHCSLVRFQLTGSELNLDKKQKLAEQAKEALITQKLWEKLDNKDKDLKKLREVIENLLNSI
jgi:hypothetical protein